MSRRGEIEKLILEHHRHLQKLKEQEAKWGSLQTPTHILTAIEDREKEIERLQDELESLSSSVQVSRHGQVKIYHNLRQPDYEHFIGRKHELKQIQQLLLPYPKSRHFVITIDGIGGIGKSALALETAYTYLHHYDELAEEERFEAIIWATAKQTFLTGEGILTRSQALRTLDDIYTTIALTLQREDITRAHPNKQDELVRNALTQQRTLIIIDNFETVVDDDKVIGFIHDLPDPTKIIVTTRHRIDVAYPIRILGMSEDEGLALIANEAALKSVELTPDQDRQLFKRTGGVPLAMVWSVALMGFGYGVEAVLNKLGEPHSDIARYCFEAALERIKNKPAHKLLMAMSLFPTGANREMLGHIAELSTLDRDEGLVELEKLSLVNKEGPRFSLLPLTKTYGLNELKAKEDFAKSITERWAKQLTGLLAHGADQYWLQNQEIILKEGDNFFSLLNWAVARNDCETALDIIIPTILYLQYTGRRAEALTWTLDGIELARKFGRRSTSAWLSVDSGWILGQQGDDARAIAQIEAGLQEYQLLANESGECFAKCFLAQALRHSGQIEIAAALLEEVIGVASRLQYREGLSIAKFELGKLAQKQKQWDKAYQHFAQAYTILSEHVGGELTDVFSLGVQGNYATGALRLAKYAEAKDLTLQVLDALEKWQDLANNFNVRMRLQLAEIERLTGNYTEALKHARQALEFSQSKGNTKGIRDAEQAIKNLETVS